MSALALIDLVLTFVLADEPTPFLVALGHHPLPLCGHVAAVAVVAVRGPIGGFHGGLGVVGNRHSIQIPGVGGGALETCENSVGRMLSFAVPYFYACMLSSTKVRRERVGYTRSTPVKEWNLIGKQFPHSLKIDFLEQPKNDLC